MRIKSFMVSIILASGFFVMPASATIISAVPDDSHGFIRDLTDADAMVAVGGPTLRIDSFDYPDGDGMIAEMTEVRALTNNANHGSLSRMDDIPLIALGKPVCDLAPCPLGISAHSPADTALARSERWPVIRHLMMDDGSIGL